MGHDHFEEVNHLFHLFLWSIYHSFSGWWYTYPNEEYEFVNWDDDSQVIWKNKSHVPVTTNQP